MYTQSLLKDIVDRALANLSYYDGAGRLADPVKYILSAGGKRLRPVMALMACNLFSDRVDDALLPAAGLEVFHNFTLVHDDIMDNSPVRRGFPTVHRKWNVNQAILSGDVMAFIANECILKTPENHLLKTFTAFNRAAIEVCVGQQLDMDFESVPVVTPAEYTRMIELKTASLIAASLQIGAIIGGADEKNTNLLREFGKNLGLAFQVQDDLLDIWGDSGTFGKRTGGDIVTNKKTYPYVKALETAPPKLNKQLHDLFSRDDIDPGIKISKVIDIYNRLSVREETEDLANGYINRAFELLGDVGVDASVKKELANLASSLIGRDR
jgi:geranylgeranyl diphosphate synthase type II